MKVELLYFEGCPSYKRLLPHLREIVGETAPDAKIELRRVESVEQAERERFLGSPTVRIDGADVDPGAESREEFGMECRLYRTEDGLQPLPPENWIRKALSTQSE